MVLFQFYHKLPCKSHYIAFEYPLLIGTGRSISKVKPGEVRRFSKVMRKSKSIPLCGAGISNGKDVNLALQLGTRGVLLASAVAKAKNPGKIIKELVKYV